MIDQSHLNIESILSTANMKMMSGEWKGACPKCHGKDRFVIFPTNHEKYGGNGGKFMCRKCHDKVGDCLEAYMWLYSVTSISAAKIELGGFMTEHGNGSQSGAGDLSEAPGEAPPPPPAKPAPPKAEPKAVKQKRQTLTHEAYAKRLGVPIHYLIDTLQWERVSGGFIVPHTDGVGRKRNLTATGAKWFPVTEEGDPKVKRCLYRFDEAVFIAQQTGTPLVFCNGQSSVAAAQYRGLAAFAQTDGELRGLDKKNLDIISKELDTGLKIVIALDADNQGRKQANLVLEQLETYAPGHVDFGSNDKYDLGDYCANNKDKSWARLKLLISDLTPVNGGTVVTHKQTALNVNKVLYGDVGHIRGEILTVPWKSLQKLGGFARRLQPKNLAAIAAPSGDGKTTLIETLCDEWLKLGFDVLMYGPEWSDEMVQIKRVQRNGGITVDQYTDHKIWLQDSERGIPEEQRQGQPLTSEQVASTDDLNYQIGNWPGQMHCFPTTPELDDLITDMIDKIRYLRRCNRRVALCVFDHAQILETATQSESKTSYETIITKIKQFVQVHDTIGLVGVQVTKAAAQSARNEKRLLGKNDGHWVRPFEFNLYWTINRFPDVDPETQAEIPGTLTRINTAKNSNGKQESVPCIFDGETFAFYDRAWPAGVLG